MADLVQQVKEGKVVAPTSSSTPASTKKTNGELGKDEFLQLLVAQMKYQDPLNPSSDTEYVSQLATFSQLEQMQNLNLTATNSQVFSLVGKDVIVQNNDSTSATTYKTGVVDYVTMSNGKAQLSIEGNLYSIDRLTQVYDSAYLIEQGLPKVQATNAVFDKSNPTDITFNVDLGQNATVATKVAVVINDTLIDSKYINLSGNKVTISKDALSGLNADTYKAIVGFNDALKTTVTDKLTIKVTDSGN